MLKEEEIAVSSEQRQSLLERILASPQFAKSPKLSAFLSYICEQERLGRAHQINEQRIGVAVFGRHEGYSAGDDSIVRSQARFLRLHLEEYFAKEGNDEPIVLSIPKGSYIPTFPPRAMAPKFTPEERTAAEAATSKNSAIPVSFWTRPSAVLLAFLLLCAGLLVSVLAIRSHQISLTQKAYETSEQRFWNAIFDARRTPIIVPSDSSLVLLQKISGHTIALDDYINHKYVSDVPDSAMKSIWPVIANSQYTSLADLNLVSRLEQQPAAIASSTRIRYARNLSLKELKENNVILIGGSRSNPWVELYRPLMRMSVDYDQTSQRNFVWNHNPAAGEQEYYYETGSNNVLHAAYGIIAYLPSLDGQGTALLVGGTSKAGTEAAAEFLFSSGFAEFLHRLNNGKNPSHFEILIATENINGESNDGKIVCFHRL